MNRRGFLAGLGAMVAGIALEKAVPLGRVWSFPKEIKPLNLLKLPNPAFYYDRVAVENFKCNVVELSGIRIIRTTRVPRNAMRFYSLPRFYSSLP